MPPKQGAQREYDFTLLLDGIAEISAEVENALFEAGCDDATINIRFGRVYLMFTREAASIKDAVISAIRDVRGAKTNAKILRVDTCDLVTQAEIARRMGRTRQLVNQYVTGTRGPGSFPAPACNVSDSGPMWYWREVAQWLWQGDLVEEHVLREARELAVINGVLDLEYQRQLDPDLTNEIMRVLAR